MLHKNKWVTMTLVGAAAMMIAPEAKAEFWNGLQMIPNPNLILGVDTSVTMGIFDAGSGGCGPGCHTPTRSMNVASQIASTLPMFRDYFDVGYFEYRGCGEARIVGSSRIMPSGNSLGTATTNGTILYRLNQQATWPLNCGSRESRLPGNAAANCLTATALCSGDLAEVENIIYGVSPFSGLAVTPPVYPNLLNETALACEDSSTLDVQAEVTSLLSGATWPRWFAGANVPPGQVLTRFCAPMDGLLNDIKVQLQACLPSDAFDGTSAIWDMTFRDAPNTLNSWCDHNTISTSACAPNLNNTCVCDDSNVLCNGGGTAVSACGENFTWRARQQVAVCESYWDNPATPPSAPATSFGDFFDKQPDNIINTNPSWTAQQNADNYCRENVAMFLTDGWEGHRGGVGVEANNALFGGAHGPYTSGDGLSNMFVLRATNVFMGDANGMGNHLDPITTPGSYSAATQTQVQESMAQILNRIYKGVYAGANFGMDQYQTMAAFHTFTVPGYDGLDNSSASNASHDYLGYPTRLSIYNVDDNGNLMATPAFETDWESRVNSSYPGSCPGSMWNGATNSVVGNFGPYVAQMGPDGSFSNGVSRRVTINNNSDRSGDGVNDATPERIIYGKSFGFAHTTPVVVDRPRLAAADFATTDGVTAYADFTSQAAIDRRPRAIYSMDGGYVLGYHGGDYQGTAVTYGSGSVTLNRANSYSMAAPAGGEIFRYRPSWVDDATPNLEFDYTANDTIQQPLTTGQLRAMEVFLPNRGTHAPGSATGQVFTVLAGNQGREGRGYFVADISNPCNRPDFVHEYTLPQANDRASSEPVIYPVRIAGGEIRPMLFATSGLAGRDDVGNFLPANNRVYMWDISSASNVPYSFIDLPMVGSPAGERAISYATKPICVDANGKGGGAVTDCYVLRTDGHLAGVSINATGVGGGFTTGSVVDLSPVDSGGTFQSKAGNRRYFTAPVVYFGSKGEINVLFGSGNFEDLTTPESGNAVYKIRDERYLTTTGSPRGELEQVCDPASGQTNGIINLPAGHRLLSAPIVADGVVAWATYSTTANGCSSGNASLYAIDFERCTDVITPASPTISPTPVGDGIPTSPVLHRQSDQIMVQTSEDVLASQAAGNNQGVETTTGRIPTIAMPRYWRMELKIP